MASNDVNFDLKLAIADYNKSLQKANQNMDKFSGQFEKSTNKMNSAWSSFAGNLAANAVTALASGMASFAVGTIDAAKSLESMSTELGVMLGSAKAGEDQLRSLQEFAATTPFQLPGIVDATKLLLGFGTEAEKLPEVLTTLGNIAAGSAKPLADLARIFGQVQAETKLSLERLNQLNDAGINLGSTLATKLNIPLKDVRKQVTLGKVSFDLFRESMVAIQSEGGTYADAMIKQSKTLSGVLSTLSDNVFNLQGSIGQQLLPMIKIMALAFIDFTQTIGDNLDVIKNAAIGLAGLAGAWLAYTGWVNAAAIAQASLNAIMLLNPYVAAAAALLALGVALKTYIDRTGEATGASNKLKTAVANLADLETQLAKARDMGSSARITDSIQARIDKEKELIKTLTTKKEVVLSAEEVEAQAIINEKARIAEIQAVKNQASADEIALLESRVLTQEEIAERVKAIQEKAAKDFKTINDNKIKDELKAQADAVKKKEAARKKAIKNQQTDEQKNTEFTKTLFGNVKSFEESTGKERADNLKSTLGTMATLSKSGNKTLAAIGKAAAISTATIDGFAAVQKALASAPPPFNFVLAGIVGAATAANVASIAGVNFAQGGIVGGSSFTGDNVGVNVNSSEMILNKGQQSTLFNLANNGGGNSGGMIEAIEALGNKIAQMEIVLVASDNEIARSASRGFDSGIVIGRN